MQMSGPYHLNFYRCNYWLCRERQCDQIGRKFVILQYLAKDFKLLFSILQTLKPSFVLLGKYSSLQIAKFELTIWPSGNTGKNFDSITFCALMSHFHIKKFTLLETKPKR